MRAPCAADVSARCCSAALHAALAGQHPRGESQRWRKQPQKPARKGAHGQLSAGCSSRRADQAQPAHAPLRRRRPLAPRRWKAAACAPRSSPAARTVGLRQSRLLPAAALHESARRLCWHLWQRAVCRTMPRRRRAASAAPLHDAARGRQRTQALLHLQARVRQLRQLRAQRSGVRRHGVSQRTDGGRRTIWPAITIDHAEQKRLSR